MNAQLSLLARLRPEVATQLSLSAEEARELVAQIAQLLMEAVRSTANPPEESSDD
jgi:hypothetical protein